MVSLHVWPEMFKPDDCKAKLKYKYCSETPNLALLNLTFPNLS